ncbi:MAG: diamine N-acetyltransferase [Candidatus Sumerlaeota bacterium]|nr:diamine N-acetyltransferase [Candidatus Sumerlaeota bacterium]
MINPFVVGETVYLRPMEPADGRLLAACNNDPTVRVSFFTHTPTSVAMQEDFLRTVYAKGSDYLPFAICRVTDDQAVGVTALHRVDLVSRAAVFSVCLCDGHSRGKGFAKEATHLMMRYAFDVLNLHRVQLHVWTENQGAIHIYESAGFQREGLLREAMAHDGKYCDFLVMGLLEDEWRSRKR